MSEVYELYPIDRMQQPPGSGGEMGADFTVLLFLQEMRQKSHGKVFIPCDKYVPPKRKKILLQIQDDYSVRDVASLADLSSEVNSQINVIMRIMSRLVVPIVRGQTRQAFKTKSLGR